MKVYILYVYIIYFSEILESYFVEFAILIFF